MLPHSLKRAKYIKLIYCATLHYSILKFSLNMMSKQTNMAASAPMLSLSVCPSWINSQFSPQNPSGQLHRYRSFGSKLMQVPPFRQGKSRHSSLSMQSLPSGDMIRPSPQLYVQRGSKENQACVATRRIVFFLFRFRLLLPWTFWILHFLIVNHGNCVQTVEFEN